ncbi:MAG: family 2A encapsulin nanocompartment cargo protein cysteine desulfurase [Hyphomicrobium sp.]
MTTIDQLAAAALAGQASPAGLPDVAQLARLANELFAALPGQSAPTKFAGPSLPGAGVSPAAASSGATLVEPPIPSGFAPSPAAASTGGVSPALGGSPEITPTIALFPDAAILVGLAQSAAGAAPGQSLPAPGGPSLPGFGGASSTPLSGATVFEPPLGAATPIAGAPAAAIPLNPPNGTPAPAGSPTSAPHGLAGIDLGQLAGLTAPPTPVFHQSIGATNSLAGSGVSPDSASIPGGNSSAALQPPDVTPPPQVLLDNGIQAPSSAGSITGPTDGASPVHTGGHVPIPFETDLKVLLAPLAQDTSSIAPIGASTSDFYFLNHVFAPTADHTPGLASQFSSAHPAFDVNAIRRDFPILNERVNGKPLIWFDNAATTQKPKSVIDRITYFYEHENSNIHRAAHELAARATDAYEGARSKVARFLGASSPADIIFTRGATEAVNLVAATFGHQHVNAGDEIVITNLEHHANIVPWQMLCLAKGAKLRVAPVDDHGALLLDEFSKLLNNKTKIVAFTQVSNALGTITPAKTIVDMAKRVGARVLVDGAQSVSHMKVDVQDIGADFFVFSGHKLFAPTGIGVLYAKPELMDTLPPYQTGGNMIRDVTFERTEIHGSPQRFEAGTGNIADAVGLGAAIDYVERIGLDNIGRYEHGLLEYGTRRLLEIPNLRIIGTAPDKASVISLIINGLPSEEIGAKLNAYGIAVRSGHHCAQPILRRFGQETTVRPSFAFYNTCGEIDVLVAALKDIQAETGLPRV